MEIEKIAYIAGLIDGEGWIGYIKQNGIRIKVKMTDEATVRFIHKTLKLGGVYKEIPKKEHYKPLFNWVVSFNQALKVLELVSPYLITKKEKALFVLKKDKNHKSKNKTKPPCGG